MTDRLLATLMFFTRLPLWRLKNVDKECFRHVVDYWPFAGWLTGGVMALAYWGVSYVLPVHIAVIVAVVVRLLFTGALHEDGLADCCDGFGGGTTREKTLAIMKDSHIGSYGVLGLVFHALLLVSLMSVLPVMYAPLLILVADVYAKACSSFIVWQLPYARKAEEAKSGVVYAAGAGRSVGWQWLRCTVAVVPCVAMLCFTALPFPWFAFLLPPLVQLLLTWWMRRCLQGYTGDCCGALFLFCELGFYMGVLVGLA